MPKTWIMIVGATLVWWLIPFVFLPLLRFTPSEAAGPALLSMLALAIGAGRKWQKELWAPIIWMPVTSSLGFLTVQVLVDMMHRGVNPSSPLARVAMVLSWMLLIGLIGLLALQIRWRPLTFQRFLAALAVLNTLAVYAVTTSIDIHY